VLGYGPDSGAKPITAYLRKRFELSDPALVESLTLRVQRDDGVVVYLNGTLVTTDNMPAGDINSQTTAASTIYGDAETQWVTHELDAANALVRGMNLIAVELHQVSPTSSDLRLDLELEATMGSARGLTRDLVPGWNLASLPLAPESTAPGNVLASIVGCYELALAPDAGEGSWLAYDPSAPTSATLTAIDELTPFWLHMTHPGTLVFRGMLPNSTTQPLAPGWNLISVCGAEPRPVAEALASIAGNYSVLWGYQPGASDSWRSYSPGLPDWRNDLGQLEPGYAYWVHSTAECLLVMGCE